MFVEGGWVGVGAERAWLGTLPHQLHARAGRPALLFIFYARISSTTFGLFRGLFPWAKLFHGLGGGQGRGSVSGATVIQPAIQLMLLNEFNPPIDAAVARGNRGRLVIKAAALQKWLEVG